MVTPDLKYIYSDCYNLREQLKIHIHKSHQHLQGEFSLFLSSLFITVLPSHLCFSTPPCVPLPLCTVHHPFFNTFSLHLNGYQHPLVPTMTQLTSLFIAYLT